MMNDWEERANSGEGSFAIALALFEVARQIKNLGNADAMTSMGAIEGLAAHLGERLDGVANSLDAIGNAIEGLWSEAPAKASAT